MKNSKYVYMGIGVSPDEERIMRDAHSVPFIVFGGRVPKSGQEVIHDFAIEKGLPEIKGYYGYDFEEHEFCRIPTATDGPPDAWPSRKLSDILSETPKVEQTEPITPAGYWK